MRQIYVKKSDLLPDDEVAKLKGRALLNEMRQRLVLYDVGGEDTEVFAPDGSLLLRYLYRVLPADMGRDFYQRVREVKGSPANRPGILDKHARIPERRKDGKLSGRMGARALIVNLRREGFSIGETDLLGKFRGRNPRTRKFDCALTGWTLRAPDLYAGVLPFVHEVNATYKAYAPTEYARQLQYVDTIAEEWKIRGTVFTTLYVIKDTPTACHVDEFDYPDAFGVMTTHGDSIGAELCFPKFRVAVDYRPCDLVLANVHELHGNFPQLSGERVTCVYFCRTDQHKCTGR